MKIFTEIRVTAMRPCSEVAKMLKCQMNVKFLWVALRKCCFLLGFISYSVFTVSEGNNANDREI